MIMCAYVALPDMDTLLEKFYQEKGGRVSLSGNPELSEETAKQEGQCSGKHGSTKQILSVYIVVRILFK